MNGGGEFGKIMSLFPPTSCTLSSQSLIPPHKRRKSPLHLTLRSWMHKKEKINFQPVNVFRITFLPKFQQNSSINRLPIRCRGLLTNFCVTHDIRKGHLNMPVEREGLLIKVREERIDINRYSPEENQLSTWRWRPSDTNPSGSRPYWRLKTDPENVKSRF